MFRKLWRSISGIGIEDSYSIKLKNRITLANQFNFFGCLVYLLSVGNDLSVKDVNAATIDAILTSVSFSGFVINKLKRHELAIMVLYFNTLFATFYFDSYYGTATANYMYYFPLIIGIAFLFDPEKDRYKMLIYVLLTIAAVLTNLLTDHKLFASHNISPETQKELFLFNMIFSSCVLGFFVYVVIIRNIQQNKMYEKQILDQKEAKDALRSALNEKNILLAELHHRVKNNLAIISGLFSFTIDSTNSEETRRVLTESKTRIHSMALIHNKLYQRPSLDEVRFDEYINDLVNEVKLSFPDHQTEINIVLELEPVSLNINKAIPCGLILNELLINCYKHAFKNRAKGTILIILCSEGPNYYLLVIDDGVGINTEEKNKESIGMMLIQALTEQIDATHTLTSNSGTHFEMKLKK